MNANIGIEVPLDLLVEIIYFGVTKRTIRSIKV